MQEGMEVTGIVLQSAPYGEADRRILLLTKELGKISAFVRGARRPTSTMVGLTRPFAFGTFTVYPGKSAYSVSKADIQEYFEELTKDVAKSCYGCYFLDLANYFTQDATGAKEELLLLYFALKALSKGAMSQKLVQIVYELRLLKLQGVVPDFSTCGRCRKPMTEGFFDRHLLLPVCTGCHTTSEELSLQKSALFGLSFIENSELPKLFSFQVKEEVFLEMSKVVRLLMHQNMDRELASYQMLAVMVDAE